MKQYEGNWMRPGPWNKQLEVIDALERSTLPVFLGLLGGEPTSHHKYFKLLRQITDRVLTHKDSRLYITSNGAKSYEFFESHPDSNGKMYMLWSFHPEYMEDAKAVGKFIDNVLLMRRKGFKTKVNVMLHPKKEYWHITKQLLEVLNIMDDIELHPHFIYSDQHNHIKYSNDFYEYFSFIKQFEHKEFVFGTDTKEIHMSDIEIFENKHNQFKGWNCWNNNYEIGLDCQIQQFCFEDPHPITKNYFKNIKSIEPKRCPFDYCSCDGLLKIKKEKE